MKYTITAVASNVRDWQSGQGGPMKGYRITIKDEQGNETQNVEWSRKATSAPPTVGQEIDGTVDTSGQYGPKFKATAGGGFGGGGRGKDIGEQRSIQMQHAQKCAVEALKLAADHGQYKPPAASDVVDHVKALSKALYDQIEQVARA